MDDRKMEIIQQLMEQLQDEMSHGKDDLASRLGRPGEDPKIEVMKLQAGNADDPDGDDDDDSHDLMGSLGGMGPHDDSSDMGDSPEEMLKQRLMKLRG